MTHILYYKLVLLLLDKYLEMYFHNCLGIEFHNQLDNLLDIHLDNSFHS